eukprot:SAG11_NODE_10466_length_830_cov_0.813953_1_plen_74_part_00
MDLAPDVGGTEVPATMVGKVRNLGPISPDFVYSVYDTERRSKLRCPSVPEYVSAGTDECTGKFFPEPGRGESN